MFQKQIFVFKTSESPAKRGAGLCILEHAFTRPISYCGSVVKQFVAFGAKLDHTWKNLYYLTDATIVFNLVNGICFGALGITLPIITFQW